MLAEICLKTHRILQGSLHLFVYGILIDIPLPENKWYDKLIKENIFSQSNKENKEFLPVCNQWHELRNLCLEEDQDQEAI